LYIKITLKRDRKTKIENVIPIVLTLKNGKMMCRQNSRSEYVFSLESRRTSRKVLAHDGWKK